MTGTAHSSTAVDAAAVPTPVASTPASVPAPHADAVMATSSSTRSSSHVPSDAAMEEMAIPTTMKRKPPAPVPDASSAMRSAAASPPTSAPTVRDSHEDPTRTTAPSMPTKAPLESPRMSGLARGFRVTPWKSAPATPSASPTTTAAAMRGIRHSSTTVRGRPVVDPVREPTRSGSATGKSPVMAATAPRAAIATSRATATARIRTRAGVRARRVVVARRPATAGTDPALTAPTPVGSGAPARSARARPRTP